MATTGKVIGGIAALGLTGVALWYGSSLLGSDSAHTDGEAAPVVRV